MKGDLTSYLNQSESTSTSPKYVPRMYVLCQPSFTSGGKKVCQRPESPFPSLHIISRPNFFWSLPFSKKLHHTNGNCGRVEKTIFSLALHFPLFLFLLFCLVVFRRHLRSSVIFLLQGLVLFSRPTERGEENTDCCCLFERPRSDSLSPSHHFGRDFPRDLRIASACDRPCTLPSALRLSPAIFRAPSPSWNIVSDRLFVSSLRRDPSPECTWVARQSFLRRLILANLRFVDLLGTRPCLLHLPQW